MTKTQTYKQSLVGHLKRHHPVLAAQAPTKRATHQQLEIRHRQEHERVLTHAHGSDHGFTDGSFFRVVRICLIKPRNPSSNKAEDRNWTLHISGHQASIVQFVRLYSTRDGDGAGAIASAEQWLGWTPTNWHPTGGGGYEVKEDGTGE